VDSYPARIRTEPLPSPVLWLGDGVVAVITLALGRRVHCFSVL
jgi:hypothetical protein